MAHYAFINDENLVVEVITGKDENELLDGLSPENWYSNFRGMKCVRTSYNAKIRFNYAGIGFTYDEIADAFIPPKPECGHEQLLLDTEIYQWKCSNDEHNLS